MSQFPLQPYQPNPADFAALPGDISERICYPGVAACGNAPGNLFNDSTGENLSHYGFDGRNRLERHGPNEARAGTRRTPSEPNNLNSAPSFARRNPITLQGNALSIKYPAPDYKPLILRWPFLVWLMSILAILLILTEASVHLIPCAPYNPGILASNISFIQRRAYADTIGLDGMSTNESLRLGYITLTTFLDSRQGFSAATFQEEMPTQPENADIVRSKQVITATSSSKSIPRMTSFSTNPKDSVMSNLTRVGTVTITDVLTRTTTLPTITNTEIGLQVSTSTSTVPTITITANVLKAATLLPRLQSKAASEPAPGTFATISSAPTDSGWDITYTVTVTETTWISLGLVTTTNTRGAWVLQSSDAYVVIGEHTVTITLSPESSVTSRLADTALGPFGGHTKTGSTNSTVSQLGGLISEAQDSLITSLTPLTNSAAVPTTLRSVITTIQTQITETLRDSRGSPIATVITEVLTESLMMEQTNTLREQSPQNTLVYMSEKVVTTTVQTHITETLRNSQGFPTATVVTDISTKALTAVWVSTAKEQLSGTSSESEQPPFSWSNDLRPSASNQNGTKATITEVYHITSLQYFIGGFLPTLLAQLISIPIRLLDLTAKQYQPFHALTSENGATAAESLSFKPGGHWSNIASFRSLTGGSLLILTTFLTAASAILPSLSASAVGFGQHGSCFTDGGDNSRCAITLVSFSVPAQATVGVLGLMAFLVLVILLRLRQWRTGIAAESWSIAGSSTLAVDPAIKSLFSNMPTGLHQVKDHEILKALGERRFKLETFVNSHGADDYGITVAEGAGDPLTDNSISSYTPKKRQPEQTKHCLPFMMLSHWSRVIFVLFLCSLLALILYYNNSRGNTNFEHFMDGQSFWVKSLFIGSGVVIAFFWTSLFTSRGNPAPSAPTISMMLRCLAGLALVTPYKDMYRSAQSAHGSILISPATNPFSGICSAVRRRHPFLALVAFTAILSEFLPILLGQVPYQITQTLETHMWCTWMTVGIICIMLLVVGGTFFLTWPHLPVNPSTIAGAMYYISDSNILDGLEGLSLLPRKDRDAIINGMRTKYTFVQSKDANGRVKMIVRVVSRDDDRA